MRTNNTTQYVFPTRHISTWTHPTSFATTVTAKNNEFASDITTRSIFIALDVFNCLFQFLCCYLLSIIFTRSLQKKTQDLFVLNLALSEFFASVFLTARDVINLMRLSPENVPLGPIDRSFWIMNKFFVTAVQYIYILAMIYITCDRCVQIRFPFRYQSCWGVKKSWRLVIGTWVTCIVIGVSFSLITHYHYMYVKYEAEISKIMSVNVLSFFYTASLLIAFVAYVYIFIQYSKSTRNRSLNPKTQVENQIYSKDNCEQNISVRICRKLSSKKISSIRNTTSWVVRTFRTSNFSIPFLLILTYLVLTVIPSITRSFCSLLGYDIPYEWTFFYLCSVRISYTVDGIIYVFLQQRVRRLLWRKMNCTGRQTNKSSFVQSMHRSAAVIQNPTTQC